MDGNLSEMSLYLFDKYVLFVESELTVLSVGTKNRGSSDILESINWSDEKAVGGAILPC